jgi:hypothetical protein
MIACSFARFDKEGTRKVEPNMSSSNRFCDFEGKEGKEGRRERRGRRELSSFREEREEGEELNVR